MSMTFSLVLLVILVMSTLIWVAHMTANDLAFEVGTLAFPLGNAEAGRVVFAQYRCHSCHRVSPESE